MNKNIKHGSFIYNTTIDVEYRDDSPVYFLIGTPSHTNIGDRAIAYAEIVFLSNLGNERKIIEVPYGVDISNLDVRDNDVIILHGGGNFGDIWLSEEEYRRGVISKNLDRKIILMPQTIFFKSKEELNKTIEIYSKCKDMTLIAREEISYKIMKRNFKSNKVILLPDIVLSLRTTSKLFHKPQRDYALFVVRNDAEKTIPDSYIHRAEDVLKYESKIDDFIYSDMHVDSREAMMNSHQFITEHKLDQFKRAKIVVTDRLHGMIFAAITNTPCLVFDSMTQKTRGVYELIKQTGIGQGIEMCENDDDISAIINRLNLWKPHLGRIDGFKSDWIQLKTILRG